MEEMTTSVAGVKTSTFGTFNPAAVGLMGPSSAEERTAKATEATAKSMKRIEEKMKVAGTAFA